MYFDSEAKESVSFWLCGKVDTVLVSSRSFVKIFYHNIICVMISGIVFDMSLVSCGVPIHLLLLYF